MTGPAPDPMQVRPGEKGLVRLFALDMPPERARFLREPGAAAQVLGVDRLDQAEIEVFPVRDLGGMGLDSYLAEGFGIAPGRLAADRDRLRALDGWVMVVRSRAFGGQAATLRPDPAVRHVGTYAEPGTDWRARPDRATAAAAGLGTGRTPPRVARAEARRIGAAIFTAVMLVVAAIVWMVVT